MSLPRACALASLALSLASGTYLTGWARHQSVPSNGKERLALPPRLVQQLTGSCQVSPVSEGLGRVEPQEKPEQTSGHSSPSMLRSRSVVGAAAKKFNHQGRFWVMKSSESRTVCGFRAWSLLGTSLTDPRTVRAATATANLQGATPVNEQELLPVPTWKTELATECPLWL